MRRAALAIALTIAGLVVLLMYQVPMSPVMPASSAATATEGTGTLARTADGPVQVQVTVASGKIIRISMEVQPEPRHRPRARARERAALDRLILETLTAQGPRIRKVGGSGSLSAGYITSLRSALRRARTGSRPGRSGAGHHAPRRSASRPGGATGQPGGQ